MNYQTALLICFLCVATVEAVAQPTILVVDGDSNGYSKILRYEDCAIVDHFVGIGTSPLFQATGITYGADGNLYVSANYQNCIYRYNGQTGRYIDQFVGQGSGGLTSPYASVFAPDGSFVVSSFATDTIIRYDGTLGFSLNTTFPGGNPLDGPTGLAFGPDGLLYVCSLYTSQVLRYQLDSQSNKWNYLGEYIASGSAGLTEPTALAFDTTGELFVLGQSCNCMISKKLGQPPTQKISSGSGGLVGPDSFVIAPGNELLVLSDGPFPGVLRYNKSTGAYINVCVIPGAGGLSQDTQSMVLVPEPNAPCYADCTGDNIVNIDDFICFQTAFALGC
jgi:WD40 repeat protein